MLSLVGTALCGFAILLLLSACAKPTPQGPGRSPAPPQGPARSPTPPEAAPVAAADARAIDAEVARITAGRHSQMPPAQQTQRVAGGQVTEIVAVNDTSYRLILLYSGPTSRRISLAPKETGAVKVQPGDYAVAARVEGAKNVDPFAGRQRFEGGRYSNNWYIRPIGPP